MFQSYNNIKNNNNNKEFYGTLIRSPKELFTIVVTYENLNLTKQDYIHICVYIIIIIVVVK